MGLSRIQRSARMLVGDRACPLCGEQAWDFQGSRVVFLVGASEGEKLADYNRLRMGGVGLRSGGGSESERALRRVSDQLKPVRQAASRNKLIQLTCNNCGYTMLPNAHRFEEGGDRMTWR